MSKSNTIGTLILDAAVGVAVLKFLACQMTKRKNFISYLEGLMILLDGNFWLKLKIICRN